jgi:hypothetical protein
MRPVIASCVVLLMSEVSRGYDLIIAMTKGGPGIATEMPAKFAVDFYFTRVNLGLASAASIMMLVLSLIMLTPYFYSEFRRRTCRQPPSAGGRHSGRAPRASVSMLSWSSPPSSFCCHFSW